MARTGAGGAVIAGALIVSFAVMPWIYGLVAFHGAYALMFKRPVLEHVVFNCSANAAVMLSCMGLTGRFDQRLTGVFARTLAVHGLLAFLTLMSRHFYSIPMMLVGVASSAFLGAVVLRFQHRAVRPTVGVLGPLPPALGALSLNCELIDDPGRPLQPYDFLILTFAGQTPPEWAPALSRAMLGGKRVRHIAEYLEEVRGLVAIEHFDLDHLPAAGLASYRSRKRLLDLFLVLLSLPLAGPLLVLAGLAILVTMGSPVFFIQRRVGLGGQPFNMVKLRTMRAAAAQPTGIATAKADARITHLGHWLRHFHLDELPQLWNVALGDMSLVGPRPEETGLAAAYAAQVPAYAYRQLVRPGITGWAQVRAGYAGDLAETQLKLGYDLFYLKNVSFALDVQILARTVWAVLSGWGAR